ncbi:helix-turn-helix domain-containing protein [Paenibacillus chungangensis]|uniref:Helix-turn-helix domain-containing protein n=1 Tax=Paenibacillus chungangensis TaxID=696535 RepID=A0ABW3HQH2_9BACL
MFRAERLTERRKHHKLTQEQLACKVNVTKAAISNYEHGRSAPPHDTLVAIVDALQTNSDYLLGISDSPYPYHQKEELSPLTEDSQNRPAPDEGVYIAYLGGPPEEMDEEEAEHLRRELEMFRAFKEKRRAANEQSKFRGPSSPK